MMKVITFINEKGGVGKTSICFNIAWEIAKASKVLLIDLDGQKANLTYFCGIKTSESTGTIIDVLHALKGIKDCIVPVKPGMDILPATANTADISSNMKISRMRAAIKEVQDLYDYVFIDVNPSPGWAHVLALSVADFCIIPMLADITSLQGGLGVAETLEEIIENTNPCLRVLGIVINKRKERLTLTREVIKTAEEYADHMGTSLFETSIREAVALAESVYEHIGVTQYASNSKVAGDVMALAMEIIGRADVKI